MRTMPDWESAPARQTEAVILGFKEWDRLTRIPSGTSPGDTAALNSPGMAPPPPAWG